MIRSIVTIAALGFALVGCATTTTEAPAPAPVVEQQPAQQAELRPVVEQAPVVEQPPVVVEQAPALTCEPDADARFDPANPDVIVNKACGYTDANGQERSHNPWIDDQLDAAREQVQQVPTQVPDVPMAPSASPGDADYEQQMDTYRQQIDEYMCAEGNAYTVPSNQRTC